MKYFCLNIEKATDRRAHCQSAFEREGIEVEFVSAFDTRHNNIRHQNPHYKVGHLGCYLSHLRLMEEVRRRDLSPAVVFEDDIRLEEGFKDRLEAAVPTLPEDWEVAFIGWWPAWFDYSKITVEQVNEHWQKVTKGALWGCYGYMINGRKGGDRLLEVLQPIVNHVDDVLLGAIVEGRVRGYFLSAPLVHFSDHFQSQTNG